MSLRRVGAMLLAALTFLAISLPSQAGVGTTVEGLLAFVHRTDEGKHQVITMTLDGNVVDRIDIGHGSQPSLSPDATRVAFRCVGKHPDICVMNADGSHRSLVTSDRARDREPSWSPDGQEIVFSRGRSARDKPSNIFIVNADGTDLRRLTECPKECVRPAWSPSGDRIAFVDRSNDQDGCLCWMSLDGKVFRHIGDRWPVSPPRWSPDSTKLVHDWGDDRLYIVDDSGNHDGQITHFDSLTPEWSPDGEWIVFRMGATKSLWMMNPDGTLLRQITTITGRWPSWELPEP